MVDLLVDDLVKKKHDLIRKLDSFSYDSVSDREADLLLLSNLQRSIDRKVFNRLKELSSSLDGGVVFDSLVTVRDLRKFLNNKYSSLVDLKRHVFDLLVLLREKAVVGRSFKDRLRGVDSSRLLKDGFEELAEEIYRW